MVSSLIKPTSTVADVRFAVGASDLGALLVAWSELGISAIQLGDNGEELAFAFERRFPGAALIQDEGEVATLLTRVASFIADPTVPLDLPLDVRGTPFELRVWAALREIPAGETASYSEVARRIGAPDAVRAVARACASNRIAVAIPCHRVIAADGNLSGYRWGVERKKALLARESAA
jgi:AraC family transcriptional regulator of adaptative response/methylated-DNA-[protein]-cysteine methyltransferase